MDLSIRKVEAASAVRRALIAVQEAAEMADVAKAKQVVIQLLDVEGQLINAHRELLELPPLTPPAPSPELPWDAG